MQWDFSAVKTEARKWKFTNSNCLWYVLFSVPPIPPPEAKVPYMTEDEATMELLFQEERMLQIQTEELMLLGDELRRKVFSEKMEIERLKTEIHEYQQLYK